MGISSSKKYYVDNEKHYVTISDPKIVFGDNGKSITLQFSRGGNAVAYKPSVIVNETYDGIYQGQVNGSIFYSDTYIKINNINLNLNSYYNIVLRFPEEFNPPVWDLDSPKINTDYVISSVKYIGIDKFKNIESFIEGTMNTHPLIPKEYHSI